MLQNQSDPVLTADSQGNIYLATIMWDPQVADNGVVVFKSVNGGRRFSPAVPVRAHIGETNPSFEDKEWITADTTGGRFNDSVYITWTSFGFDPTSSPILFSRSTDGGESFSPPLAISDPIPGSAVQGSVPRVGPNGELYVLWRRAVQGQGVQMVIDKSTDEGLTFGRDIPIAGVVPFGRLTGLARHGGTLPSLAVDRSSGPTGGRLHAVWADARNGDIDIMMARSTDGGQSWDGLLRVNDDELFNGKDQYLPFVTVDQVTGDVVVGYYDRRESVENIFVDYRIAWSTDGGVTFEPSLKLTDQPFDPSAAFRFIRAANFTCQAPFMGDCTSRAAGDGVVYPVWADTHNGRSDLFTHPTPIR